MVLNRSTNFALLVWTILITLADNFACKPIAPLNLQSSHAPFIADTDVMHSVNFYCIDVIFTVKPQAYNNRRISVQHRWLSIIGLFDSGFIVRSLQGLYLLNDRTIVNVGQYTLVVVD